MRRPYKGSIGLNNLGNSDHKSGSCAVAEKSAQRAHTLVDVVVSGDTHVLSALAEDLFCKSDAAAVLELTELELTIPQRFVLWQALYIAAVNNLPGACKTACNDPRNWGNKPVR